MKMSSHHEGSKSFSGSDGILLEESSMLILYAAAIVSLIAIIVICVCGCRKSVPKNELLGLAGKVKITNPESALTEEPVAALETSNGSAPDEIDSILITDIKHRNAVDTSTSSAGGVATATRSLPDLPIDPNGGASGGEEVWDKNGEQNSGGDTGSDLYATVEDHKMANGRLNKKVSQSTNAVLERNQSGSYASPTTDDSVSPYACYRKENPYDKVKQEHPYAQVATTSKKKNKLTRDVQSSMESTASNASSRSQDPQNEAPSSPLPPTVRTRRSSWDTESSSNHSSVRDSIPAAGAISGAVAASNELPYMTPPIVSSAPDTNHVPAGPHFSGDSQDSGKGYTCISVREPLSNISRRIESSHYTTVSDDSDETYEAIEEPSGSETYAKIAPIARPEVTSPPSHLAHASSPLVEHSRQPSNSSQASAKGNSPLPPTPEVDDMYAKVLKTSRKKTAGGARERTESFNWPSVEAEHSNMSDTRSVDLMFPVTSTANTSDPYESLTHSVGYERINKPRHYIDEDDMDPNYEAIQRKASNTTEDIGYAQIHQRYDGGYEQIHKATEDLEAAYDMGYERIHARGQVEDTYERIHRDREDNDVGYEQIHKANDARYEKIHRNVNEDDENDPNYEELKTSRNTMDDDDPNYEVLGTVRRVEPVADNQNKDPVQHNYASINKYNKRKYRQSEPNFASINNNESTYECMNDCQDEPDARSHKRSNSVSRVEVEPNVFYSQVQKLKR